MIDVYPSIFQDHDLTPFIICDDGIYILYVSLWNDKTRDNQIAHLRDCEIIARVIVDECLL